MVRINRHNMDFRDPVLISVVVPVYLGEPYLEEVARAVESLRRTWESAGAPLELAELILVDDAARDGSPALIDRLASERPWVVPLHLSRNFGQHAATIAGVLHSAGDWIVTMDEDLQHPPTRIPELLEAAVRAEADIVYAKPEGAVHGVVMRDLTSRGFKRVMSWLTGDPNLPNYNSFRLIRGQIGRAAASVCGHDTYFDVSLSWFTQRVETVGMALKDLRFMRTGRSGYGFRTLVSHAHRMLFSSSLKVLRGGVLLGLAVLGLTFLAALWLLVVRIVSPQSIGVQGWTSVMLAMAFFGGMAILMLGLSLQYLSTLVLRAHGKPTFFTVDRSRDVSLARWFDIISSSQEADAVRYSGRDVVSSVGNTLERCPESVTS